MSQFDALFKTDAKAKTETKSKQPKKDKTVDKAAAAKADTRSSKSEPTSPPPDTRAVKAAPKKQIADVIKRTGKSSNSDYTQVLSYVRRDTHNAVKAALIFDEQRRDLSDLIEELLAGWVKNNSR